MPYVSLPYVLQIVRESIISRLPVPQRLLLAESSLSRQVSDPGGAKRLSGGRLSLLSSDSLSASIAAGVVLKNAIAIIARRIAAAVSRQYEEPAAVPISVVSVPMSIVSAGVSTYVSSLVDACSVPDRASVRRVSACADMCCVSASAHMRGVSSFAVMAAPVSSAAARKRRARQECQKPRA